MFAWHDKRRWFFGTMWHPPVLYYTRLVEVVVIQSEVAKYQINNLHYYVDIGYTLGWLNNFPRVGNNLRFDNC